MYKYVTVKIDNININEMKKAIKITVNINIIY